MDPFGAAVIHGGGAPTQKTMSCLPIHTGKVKATKLAIINEAKSAINKPKKEI